MPDGTVPPYEKDHHFEDVLADFNDALRPVELKYISQFDQPRYPVLLIGGTQRSGTTLLMQLLIACFDVGYVSNLMARFWKVPYIGALLAQELRRKRRSRPPDFTSKLGTTYGYEGPHEFGYFWRYWFPYNETHQASQEDLASRDFALFRRELAAMESVFDAPLAFKNPIVFSLNIAALAEILPTALFLICRRDPLYVAQSTLLSRLEFHGRKDAWFSVKPREYVWLKERTYPEQLAGQAFYTEQRIKRSLADISPDRHLTINYQDLCADPQRELARIEALVSRAGGDLARTDYRPEPFRCTNVQRVDDGEFARLEAACDMFYGADSTERGR